MQFSKIYAESIEFKYSITKHRFLCGTKTMSVNIRVNVNVSVNLNRNMSVNTSVNMHMNMHVYDLEILSTQAHYTVMLH